MKKMLTVIKTIFIIPSVPIIIGIMCWICYRIVKETTDDDLGKSIEGEDQSFKDAVRIKAREVIMPYLHVINGFCLIIWLVLIQIFFL